MNEQKQVDLIVQTKLKGSRDLSQINASISDLSKTIEKQSEAAKRGESSIEGLTAAQRGLKAVQDELAGRSSIIKQVEGLTEKIDKQAAAVARAKQRLDEYSSKTGADRTDAQQRQVQQLTDRYTSATQRLDSFRRSLDTLKAALAQSGVDTSNLGAAQTQIQAATLDAAVAFNRANAEIRDYTANVNKAREAARLLAEQQARLRSRLTTGNEADARLGGQQQAARAEREAALLARLQAGNEADSLLGGRQQQARAARLAEEQAELIRRLQAGNAADAKLAAEQQAQRAAALAERQAELVRRLQAGNEADARLGAQQTAQRAAQTAEAQAELLRRLQAGAAADAAHQADQQARLLSRFRAGNETDAQVGLRQGQSRELGAAADASDRLIKQFDTLSKASTNLTPKVTSVSEAIRAIVNPTDQALKSITGIEQRINDLSTSIAKARGPVKDYSGQFEKLRDAQRAIGDQASLIDGFRNQIEAVKAARAAYVDARQKVLEYTAAVRAGGDTGAANTKPLADAQNKLRAASIALNEQLGVIRQMGASLNQAGLNVGNLTAAEQRLVGATQQTTAALKQLDDQVKRNGQSLHDAGKGFSLFRDEGRTTLSITQRLRGEVLSMITAYVGVRAAIGLAADALKSFNTVRGLEATLEFALGDAKKTGAEIEYLKAQAERLGISFEQAGKGYAHFAASAIRSGATVNEARFIFESFSEVGRVLQKSPEDLNRLFTAIGQSFSKGKIQAEELQQQLSEHLPAAFALAQEALKSKFPDLSKALKDGVVGAENMVIIAQSVRKAAEGPLKKSISSLDAEQQRFNNSVFFFKQQIAEAGFADAYLKLLKELTTVLSTDSGKNLAKDLGELAASLVRGLGALVEYRKEIGALASILAGLVTAGWLSNIAASMGGLTASMIAGRVAAIAFTPLVFSLASAFGALGAAVGTFVVTYSIAKYFYDEYAGVRVFGAKLVGGVLSFLKMIEYGFKAVFVDGLPDLVEAGLISVVNKATFMLRKLASLNADLYEAMGFKDLAASLRKFNDAVEIKPKALKSMELLGKELDKIRQTTEELVAAELNPAKAIAPPKATAEGTTFPGVRNPKPGLSDKDIHARDRIRKALDALNAGTLNKQGESLQSMLDAVDLQNADLLKQIKAIGGKDGAAFMKEFERAIDARKDEITKDFFEKLGKDYETLQTRIEKLDAEAGRKNKLSLEERQAAIEKSNIDLFRDIEKARQRRVDNGLDTGALDELRTKTRAIVDQLKALEGVKVANEELERREKAINDALKTRKFLIDDVKEKISSGEIGQLQGEDQIKAIVEQTQPGLLSLTTTAKEFALANAAAFDPEKLREFLGLLQKTQDSARATTNEFDVLGNKVKEGIGQGIDATINSVYDSLGKVIQRTGDWGDVFDNLGKSILSSLAAILKELAQVIIKEQILILLKAISGSGGGFTGVGAQPYHSGGMVGQGNRTREVSPLAFVGAPRYHKGGMVGVGPDEQAAILQKGEQVLSKSEVRNNAKSAGSGGASVNQRIVLVDDTTRIPEAMASSAGEEVTLMHIKRNIPTLRQLFKG